LSVGGDGSQRQKRRGDAWGSERAEQRDRDGFSGRPSGPGNGQRRIPGEEKRLATAIHGDAAGNGYRRRAAGKSEKCGFAKKQ
jgi:hypothetical protein